MFWVDSVSSSHAATKNTDRTRVNKKNTHIKHLLNKDSCEVIHGAYGVLWFGDIWRIWCWNFESNYFEEKEKLCHLKKEHGLDSREKNELQVVTELHTDHRSQYLFWLNWRSQFKGPQNAMKIFKKGNPNIL